MFVFSLKLNQSLKKLSLENNEFQSKEVVMLGEIIKDNTGITKLNLSNCKIEDEVIFTLFTENNERKAAFFWTIYRINYTLSYWISVSTI